MSIIIALNSAGIALSESCSVSPNSKWFTPDKIEAAAVVVHGLNNKPQVMDELAELLSSKGVATLRLALEGHDGDAERQARVTAEMWLENLRSAECHLKKEFPELPYMFVGYSLGAPIVLALDDQANRSLFNSYIFLAPALGLNCRACILRLLLPLKYLGVSLPSLAPEEYRALSSTSLAAYSATFKLVDKVASLSNPEIFQNSSGLIVVDPKDEMVSISQTQRWLSINHLQSWRLMEVGSQTDLPKHLLVDKKSFGSKSWKLFSDALDVEINELKK